MVRGVGGSLKGKEKDDEEGWEGDQREDGHGGVIKKRLLWVP